MPEKIKMKKYISKHLVNYSMKLKCRWLLSEWLASGHLPLEHSGFWQGSLTALPQPFIQVSAQFIAKDSIHAGFMASWLQLHGGKTRPGQTCPYKRQNVKNILRGMASYYRVMSDKRNYEGGDVCTRSVSGVGSTEEVGVSWREHEERNCKPDKVTTDACLSPGGQPCRVLTSCSSDQAILLSKLLGIWPLIT